MGIKEDVKNRLFELSDKRYKEFHGGLCPGTDNIIGVRVPDLRSYAKELSKQYDVKVLLNEIDNEFYEEIMLQGMLIGLEKCEFSEIIKEIQEFVPKIDNWAVCDVFCGGLKITRKYKKEMYEFIRRIFEVK